MIPVFEKSESSVPPMRVAWKIAGKKSCCYPEIKEVHAVATGTSDAGTKRTVGRNLCATYRNIINFIKPSGPDDVEKGP